LAVEAVCELIPNEKRSQVTVLDVAAGTGLVGLEVIINFLFPFQLRGEI
jgi:16S rRNA G966 N2-methylase RsmD